LNKIGFALQTLEQKTIRQVDYLYTPNETDVNPPQSGAEQFLDMLRFNTR